ncbi:hypothetical protein DER29_5477 [Micromonospora sp. M71_S20]|uniref:hypothetical protein n=1 Tax=Micromonospora sp. M71_S20 TaxID=592872 RepID=UPI000F0F8205|nr:hypothetical protein [Micromonospora sp. M71_S20]RLK12200.1 hypothetical protein DER29_5477 [Micromonospora sp. M71_S20]
MPVSVACDPAALVRAVWCSAVLGSVARDSVVLVPAVWRSAVLVPAVSDSAVRGAEVRTALVDGT